MEANDIKSIEHYEITETIHTSAEGVIYRAFEKTSGERVLIKEYFPDLNWSEEVLNEFFNHASYLRFIEHDYLLTVLDLGKHLGRPYIVFADHVMTFLCDRQAGKPDQTDTLHFLSKVAEALDFIHKQEILHGGLNPGNIAIDPHGYPLLFDFGLSGVFKKLLLENMDAGFDNLSISDPRCISPEQIMGRNPTRTSDVYMFGIVAYYYIFGGYPFDGPYPPEVALSHFTDNLVPVEAPQTISINLLHFIQKCIQIDPEKRFASFPLVLGALERMRSGEKARVRFDRRFAIGSHPASRRISRSWTWSMAGLGVMGLVLSILYFGFASRPMAAPPSATATGTASATAAPTWTHTSEPATPTKSMTATPTIPSKPAYRLAFINEKPYAPKQTISVTNLADLREISRLGYGKPEEADVAPDNRHVAVATSAGVLIFEDNQFLKWIDSQGWATSVQFSADGGMLAVGLRSGEIQLWDWQNGKPLAPLAGEWHHTGKINRILFSQGPYFYSASADRHVIVWNWQTGKSVLDIAVHAQPVNDIAVTSDGKTLVSCSDDRLIRVWDLPTKSKLYELGAGYFDGAIKAVALSSDDAFLAAGGEAGFLYQWKLVTSPLPAGGRLQPRADIVPVAKRIWSVEYIRNNQELLLGLDDGESVTYDATRIRYAGIPLVFEIPRRQKKLFDAYGSDFDFASFSVFRDGNRISVNWNGRLTIQEAEILGPLFDNLDRLDFTVDGSLLAAGGRYGSTHVWDLATNQAVYQNFYALPFGDPISPDNSTIVLIVPSEDPRVGDLYQLKQLGGAQTTMDLSTVLPNGRVGYAENGSVLIATNLQTAKAWDSAAGNEVDVLAQAYFGCLITASKNNIGERLLVNSAIDVFLPGEEAQILSLCPKIFQVKNNVTAFSRDLGLLAFVNSGGWLEGYDVLSKTRPWPILDLSNAGPMKSMAISPDAALIAVGSSSGRVILVDGKTGQPLGEIIGNFGSVQAIEFSEDGKKIATAGSDGVVRVFAIVGDE